MPLRHWCGMYRAKGRAFLYDGQWWQEVSLACGGLVVCRPRREDRPEAMGIAARWQVNDAVPTVAAPVLRIRRLTQQVQQNLPSSVSTRPGKAPEHSGIETNLQEMLK